MDLTPLNGLVQLTYEANHREPFVVHSTTPSYLSWEISVQTFAPLARWSGTLSVDQIEKEREKRGEKRLDGRDPKKSDEFVEKLKQSLEEGEISLVGFAGKGTAQTDLKLVFQLCDDRRTTFAFPLHQDSLAGSSKGVKSYPARDAKADRGEDDGETEDEREMGGEHALAGVLASMERWTRQILPDAISRLNEERSCRKKTSKSKSDSSELDSLRSELLSVKSSNLELERTNLGLERKIFELEQRLKSSSNPNLNNPTSESQPRSATSFVSTNSGSRSGGSAMGLGDGGGGGFDGSRAERSLGPPKLGYVFDVGRTRRSLFSFAAHSFPGRLGSNAEAKPSSSSSTAAAVAAASKKRKVQNLANPSKKARLVQDVEFEDEDDD